MSRSLIMSPQILVLLVVLLFLCMLCGQGSSNSSSAGEPKLRCIESERQALLKIKQDLQFRNHSLSYLLSSWGNEEENRECCKWFGIQCANKSGHVIKLDLSPSAFAITDFLYAFNLKGNISFSLVELPYLKHLDLSYIDFGGSQIPSFIGLLSELRYLNLSSTSVSGEIPPQLANLSNLQVLDLSYNNVNDFLSVENLDWLSHLSSLRILDLSSVDLSKADDWLLIINNKLPHLTTLNLGGCNLPQDVISSYLSLVNTSTSLSYLDISENDLSISIYQWIFNLSQSLVHLDLSVNLLEGPIPEAFGNMTKLTYLDLSQNLLQGEIPNSVFSLCLLRTLSLSMNNLSGHLPDLSHSSSKCTHYSLEILDLSENQITGSISEHSLVSSFKELSLSSNQLNGVLPKSIGHLTQLETLDLSRNSLNGVISEAHFSKLSKLYYLDLSFTKLILNTRFDWIPPFQLESLKFRSCKIGPQFPKWLQNQNKLLELDISNSGISESIPNWLWNLSPKLQYLNLSNNQISGTSSNFAFKFHGYPTVDLSSNQLEGSVPISLFKVATLRLSRNKFSKMDSLCGVSDDLHLTLLDVSHNQLYGELPDCWSHLKSLIILVLERNKLSGKIPISFGSLTRMMTLHLKYNNLTGELPSSLKKCRELVALDVGGNKLLGPIPTWISSMPNLVILSLRSNQFNGSIPSRLCHLQNLQLLDMSSNDISGSLHNCLFNFTAMKKIGSIAMEVEHLYKGFEAASGVYDPVSYVVQIQLVWKGTLSEYKGTLGLMKNIDLSNNKITGEIPREITELVGLVSLNLSRNSFSGNIPLKIGQLKSLDLLDLSRNHIVGRIPSSLTQIDRLSSLDLSNNNLSGKIPTGTQLQTFPSSAYMGNPGMCGDPLPKKCERDGDQQTFSEATDQSEAADELLTRGFYISMGIGFVVAFWGVFGTTLFNKSFRYAYLRLFNDVGESVCVKAATHKAKLLRLTKS